MVEETPNNDAPVKKRRPRIGETTQTISSDTTPQSSKRHRPRIAPTAERVIPQNGRYFTQTVITSRNSFGSHNSDIDILKALSTFPEEALIKYPKTIRKKVSGFLHNNDHEYDKTSDDALLPILQKYKKTFRRKYVQAVAKDDARNYASNNPKLLVRDNDIRLETLEQLRRKCDDGMLPEDKLEHIRQTYFKDILSKDALPCAVASRMLRCMAAGKFYAPRTNDNVYKEQLLSPVFRDYLHNKRKPKKQYTPEDYNFFGFDNNDKPLSPAWNAVFASDNFRHMASKIAQRMADLGISPEDAYQFNSCDLAVIMQPNKKRLADLEPEYCRDVPFTDISPLINDSPYQEFAQRLGTVLRLGKNINSRYSFQSAQKLYERQYSDSDNITTPELLLNYADQLYQKLDEDFCENGINPQFLDAWIDSMINNKSVNPNLVDVNPRPYKIDIHHWDPLSAAGNNKFMAEQNRLDNFGLMIMYDANSTDVHAEQHDGESANYIMQSTAEKRKQNPIKYLFITSSEQRTRNDLFFGMSDFYTPLKKAEQLKNKLPTAVKTSQEGITPTNINGGINFTTSKGSDGR